MAESELDGTLHVMESATGTPVASRTLPQTLDSKPVPEPLGGSPHDALNNRSTATHPDRPSYFSEILTDAERLLRYAAEMGISVDDDTRDAILRARSLYDESGWTEETSAKLLAALTKLSAGLRPVTAESLRAYHDTRPTVRTYWRVAIWLAIFIVPFSVASFVTSAISSSIRADIVIANDLAVKLRAQLGPLVKPPANPPAETPPPKGLSDVEVITELQLFAATIRQIDARARELNVLVLPHEAVPFASIRGDALQMRDKFELDPTLGDFAAAANQRVMVYQDVRHFAQSLLNDVSVFYGALTMCVLPVLYALLGTCSYLLRTFEQEMSMRTFIPSAANSARFLIAAIGGAVVGLFHNFTITEQATIPPLAIAFLVGYAVDVFFAFLEGLLQAFTRKGANQPTPSQPSPMPSTGATPIGK